jgi:hypothetical protein
VDGHVVDDAQRAQRLPAWAEKRGSGIEPDAGLTRHEWVMGKAWILRRIGYDEDVRSRHAMGAERDISRRAACLQSCLSGEELLLLANEGH